MAGELILSQLFENKEIRIIETKGDVWIPICDLANAWGIDRSTPDKIIDRNKEVFEDLFSTVLDVTSTPMSCLNERGLYLLMGKISTSRLKNNASRAAIIRFQKWFPELIQLYRKKEIVQIASNPEPNLLRDALNRNADIADIMTSRYGYDPKVARSIAMANVVNEIGDEALPWKGPAALEPPVPVEECSPDEDPDFERFFSMQKVCEICRSTRDEVINILEKERILAYSNGIWHLTGLGQQFGKTFKTFPLYPYRKKFFKMNIRYSPAAINIIKGRLTSTQTKLPAKV
ncbi:hypothetical protein, partial [Methanoregula sp.]|uniref:hypothetical protein n=1 Tax=Methanoregula sp. TaxID=2052170 RepID=UPI003C62C135